MSKKKPLYTPPAMKNRWIMEFDSSVNMSSFIVQRMTPLTYDAQAREVNHDALDYGNGEVVMSRMVMTPIEVVFSEED